MYARHVLPGHRETILRTVISKDGTLMATASIDGTCKVWDFTSFLRDFSSAATAAQEAAHGRTTMARNDNDTVGVREEVRPTLPLLLSNVLGPLSTRRATAPPILLYLCRSTYSRTLWRHRANDAQSTPCCCFDVCAHTGNHALDG